MRQTSAADTKSYANNASSSATAASDSAISSRDYVFDANNAANPAASCEKAHCIVLF